MHLPRIGLPALVLIGIIGAPARAQPAPEPLPVCLGCHGESGTSQTERVPSLGAQKSDYVIAQLLMFREKQRVAPPMNDMAAGLSDDDLQSLADAIAKLPAPQPSAPIDAAAAEEARGLIARYRCGSCHGADLAGQGQIPRIAGQREDYLAAALEGYKTNARPGYNPAMNEVSRDIRDEHIPILARYLAQYQPDGAAKEQAPRP
ncbi:c-type cytochrome [Methylobacterium sp. JK268]